jgi:hypothetical protein
MVWLMLLAQVSLYSCAIIGSGGSRRRMVSHDAIASAVPISTVPFDGFRLRIGGRCAHVIDKSKMKSNIDGKHSLPPPHRREFYWNR